MTTSRTPLRITLGGGGSDLEPGGYCVSATIDKFVTVTVSPNFDPTYVLHYSEAEVAERVSDVRHRLLRRVLSEMEVPPGVQIATSADIPAGTGLGSSGAFTVGLLRALYPEASRPRIARLACRMDIGQQDQWSAVYGGVNAYDFAAGTVRPIDTDLDLYLSLHYTGIRHDSAQVLAGQHVPRGEAMNLARDAVTALEANDPLALGGCLLAQWEAKLRRAPTVVHQQVNDLIGDALGQGAYGAKLIGAGDGGFVLVCSPSPVDLGCRQVPFSFHHEGSRCM